MFNTAKVLIAGAVAILSTSAVVAQDTITSKFRYNRALSVEANHEAYRLTAKRACDYVSTLGGLKAQRECRESLINQAVAATKVSSFTAYHQSRDETVQIASANR
jgi:hypothetical protein